MTVLLTLLASLCLAVISGLLSDVYVNILTEPGMILDFWARWLYRIRDQYIEPNEFWVTNFPEEAAEWQEKRKSQADYLLKPLLTCVYCNAGQIGLWLSFYVQLSYCTNFSLILSLVTAVLSVWMGGMFQAIQKKHFPL